MIFRNIMWIVVVILEITLILFLAIKKSNHNLKGYLSLGVTVLLLVFSIWMSLFPPVRKIRPTGNYEVAYMRDNYIDSNRLEEFNQEKTNRELEVGIWYPKNYEIDHNLPLVVFSHGSFGVISNNETLCVELASQGYFVCSISHTYHAFSTTLHDGTKVSMDSGYRSELMKVSPQKNLEESLSYFNKWMKLRTDDISFVIDTLKEKSLNNEEVYRFINKDKIAVMGHSLGGSAALGMPRLREDVTLAVALEAPFMCDIIGVDLENNNYIFTSEAYPVPVLNIYSDSSYNNLGKWLQYKENYDFLQNPSKENQSVYMKGIGHMHLCDFSLTSPMLSWFLSGTDSKTPAKANLIQINEIVLQFLKDNNF